MSMLVRDVRHGLRALRAHPGFTATAVLSLALGLGANSALFGMFNSLLWRPLPVKEPDQLVVLYSRRDVQSYYLGFSYRDTRLPRSGEGLFGPDRLHDGRPGPQERGPRGHARLRRARHGQLLRPARRAHGARARLPARGGRLARHASRGGARPSDVGAALRRRPVGGGPADHAERPRLHGGGRGAGGLQGRLRAVFRARSLDADGHDRAGGAGRHPLSRGSRPAHHAADGPPRAGRDAGRGAGRREDDRRAAGVHLPRDEQGRDRARLPRDRHAARGRDLRGHQRDRDDLPRHHRARAARRLRQRRQPDAGARRRAAARGGGAPGARRGALAASAPAADRVAARRARRRCARPRARRAGHAADGVLPGADRPAARRGLPDGLADGDLHPGGSRSSRGSRSARCPRCAPHGPTSCRRSRAISRRSRAAAAA